MSEYGSTKVFRPVFTEPDPDNPGQRRRRTANTWNYRFYYRGKRYTGGDHYTTQTQAREAGDKRRAELKAGMEFDPRRASWPVLERILLSEAELQTPVTKASHLAVLKRLGAFLGNDRLQDITRERLIEYVAHQRKEGYQDSTIRLDLRRLKTGMTHAHARGALFAVPIFPKLPLIRRNQTIPAHELEAILSHLGEEWIRYYMIADEIGWRARSEIKSRKWTDIDLGMPGWVHLDAEHSKTKKERSFPMTGRLRELLEAQRDYVSGVERKTQRIVPWVFCRPDGEPLGDPRKAWMAACTAAGFGKLEGRTGPWSSAKVPHDIRRTALRRWDALGAPLSVRMAVAGHDSAQTHAGYVGADPEALRAFAERLDEKRREGTNVTAIRKG